MTLQDQEKRRRQQSDRFAKKTARHSKHNKKKNKKKVDNYVENEGDDDDIQPSHVVEILHEEMPEVRICLKYITYLLFSLFAVKSWHDKIRKGILQFNYG